MARSAIPSLVDSSVKRLGAKRRTAEAPVDDRTLLHATPTWRVDVARLRWLLLGALGVAAGACGGQTGDEPGALAPSLGSSGGAGAATTPANSPSPGGPLTADARLACAQPVEDLGGGWERCSNGIVHRVAVGECRSPLPRPRQVPESSDGQAGDPRPSPAGDAGAASTEPSCLETGACCDEDSDCTARPHGHCALNPVIEGWPVSPFCIYGCVADSECESDQVCLCGDPVGTCVTARCRSDADCGGLACTTYNDSPGCNGTSVSCQTAADTCATDAQCGSDQFCSDNYRQDASRSCMGPSCDIGRPFLIDGCERLAASTERDDWYTLEGLGAPGASVGDAASDDLASDAEARSAVSRGWLAQALMEHASVAAFARFALQLSSLGAPPELLDGAASAMRDEIRHARACFDLARRFGDRDLGPGPLSIAGALDGSSLEEIVVATILEGCIGETVAALEAAEARACCVDPSARAVLAEIERDESEHARLAWSFVAWALQGASANVRERARRTFELELASVTQAVAPAPHDAALLRHGLMPASLRGALRERVLREVVGPCQRALFEKLEPLASSGRPEPHRGRALEA